LKEINFPRTKNGTKEAVIDLLFICFNSLESKKQQDHDNMIEITCNDRLGKKIRVKCNPDDTIGDLKKLVAAQTGTHYDRIVLKKWYNVFKDNITLADYEIHDGMNIELYYQ